LNKGIVLSIVFLLAGMSFTSISGIQLNNQIVKTSGRGDILYVGGSGPGNYTFIQDAINNSFDGDTVFVYNGTYNENVIVNKSINLVGKDKYITIIDGTKYHHTGYENAVFLSSDGCVISNLTLMGGDSGTFDSGIRISSDFNIIENCRLINSKWGSGIYMGGDNNKIFYNNISGNRGYGIWKYSSDVTGNIIKYNMISSNGMDGIRLIRYNGIAYNNLIYNNNFIKNRRYNADDKGNNTWDNGKLGNYWDDYKGTDSNGDGIGDIPYNISGGSNQDHFPLMHPYGSITNLDTGEIFLTIQDAINDYETLDGHSIYVKKGIYYENLLVNKSINLIGEDRNTTVVDGSRISDVFYISTDGVNIRNFCIMNSSLEDWPLYGSGIEIDDFSNSKISNCVLFNNYYGIKIRGSLNNISNCEIYLNHKDGVRFTGYSNNLKCSNIYSNKLDGAYIDGFSSSHISNCSIYSNDYCGIHLDGTSNTDISNTNFFGNKYGIYIYPSSNNSIMDCDIQNNEIGIHINALVSENNTIIDNKINYNEHSGVLLNHNSRFNIIKSNNISSNNHHGIRIINSHRNNIEANIISFNKWDGIYLAYSNNNTIVGNKIISNMNWGICLDYLSSIHNIIYHNNFINNSIQNAYDISDNIWDDGKYGNYWDDYEEKYPNAKPKLFKPWMWDTSYEIPGGNNTDNCPLVKEWPNPTSIDITRNKALTNPMLLDRILERFPLMQRILKF
jgi:parallel beta-helix repeat protein